MTQAEAYRRQAASDLRVFELLLRQPADAVPDCHRLHYLQMGTEKAAKAVVHALGGQLPREGHSHAFVGPFVQSLKRRSIGEALEWASFHRYQAWLTSIMPLLSSIQGLHPTSDESHPNVEYPWYSRGPRGHVSWQVPAECGFRLNLRSRECRDPIIFVRQLLDRLDALAALRPRRGRAWPH